MHTKNNFSRTDSYLPDLKSICSFIGCSLTPATRQPFSRLQTVNTLLLLLSFFMGPDLQASANGCSSGGHSSLPLQPGDDFTFTANSATISVDIDNGQTDNQAVPTDTPPTVTLATDQSKEELIATSPALISPLALICTGLFNDTNDNGCAEVGEMITYTYIVTNSGDERLTDLTLEDYLLRSPNLYVELIYNGGDTDADDELDADETWTYTADYRITQADIDRGRVDNQARVTAKSPGLALYSALWGENGELWNPNGKLRDITDVGYMEGDVPIPDWPIGVNVLDFGAVGDGVHDDTQAFRDAIAACPDFTAVFVPNGRYKITDWIRVTDQDYFVLRGEDTYGTVLWFPNNLSEVRPEEDYVHARGAGFFDIRGGTHRSIENFTFEFRDEQHSGHFSGTGANGIFYSGVEQSWVRNIYVRNANLGVRIEGENISVVNIVLDQYEGRAQPGDNAVGHYGLVLSGGSRNLAHNIFITGSWHHDIGTHQSGNHHVFSKIVSLADAVITHKGGSDNTNVWTDINIGEGTNFGWFRPNTIYWNIRGRSHMSYPPTDLDNVAVGITTDEPSSTEADHWHEAINPDSLYPQNIYLAQMEFAGKPLPESTLILPPAWPAPNPSQARPVDDSYVDSRSTDASLGQDSDMRLHRNQFRNGRPFLKFNFQESILGNAKKATLRLYQNNTSDPINVVVYGIENDSWTEDSLNYNNQPLEGISIDTISVDGEPGWHEWDITSFVNDQLAGDRIVSLYLDNPDLDGSRIDMNSDEANNSRPILILTPQDDAPPQPPLIPELPGPGTIVTDLSGNAADNDTYTSIYLCQNPLPVELIKFTATAQEKRILLEWETAIEQSNRGFHVQRRLTGEADFQTIAWVEGAVNSSEITTYEFIDSELRPGILAYYRLQQVDADGTTTFSVIRSAELQEDRLVFSVFPNPTTSGLVTVSVIDGELQSLMIYDQLGREVLETNTLNIAVTDWLAGTYYLKVILKNGEVGVKKMIVR